MNAYNKEQADTYAMVQSHLGGLSSEDRQILERKIQEYLLFRQTVSRFLTEHFGNICTRKCYESQLSACCSKEGIITFFADIVVNVLVSSDRDIQQLIARLNQPHNGYKCVYLGENGCLWNVKPIVCEMFLCDTAKKEVFGENSLTCDTWNQFRLREKDFKWPDKPVLFDDLETYFMDKDFTSPLMYMHNSPGLLRVKKNAKRKNR